MANVPHLFEALLALAVNRGPDLTPAEVNALLADPSAHAEAVATMKAQIRADLEAGAVPFRLPSAESAEDDGSGVPVQLSSQQPWLSLAAVLYQTAGVYDLPLRVLDLLSAAQHDEPFDHMVEGILPMDIPVHLQPDTVSTVLADLTGALDHAVDEEAARSIKLARAFILEAAGGEATAPAREAQAIAAEGHWSAFLPQGHTVWLDPTTSPMTALPGLHDSSSSDAPLPLSDEDA